MVSVAEAFASLAGVSITHVPYKGTAPAVIDLMDGHVKAIFGLYSLMPNTREGKLRPIAVASETRLGRAPQIPTTTEGGLPGLQSGSWYGMFIQSKVPAAVRGKIYNLSPGPGKAYATDATPARIRNEQFAICNLQKRGQHETA